jgi:hypothetical protein
MKNNICHQPFVSRRSLAKPELDVIDLTEKLD